jgi:hypothetical protein
MMDHLQAKIVEHTALASEENHGQNQATMSYHAGAIDAYQHSLTGLRAQAVSVGLQHVGLDASSSASEHASMAVKDNAHLTAASRSMGYDNNYHAGASDAYAGVAAKVSQLTLPGVKDDQIAQDEAAFKVNHPDWWAGR